MKVIDFFAGCGGLSLGFQNVGFDIQAGFDNWQAAINVYKENFLHPAINIDLAKIEDFTLLKKYNANMIIGGPPCQDFSSAGKRTENDRANLTIKFAEIVVGLKPSIFVMENVSTIITTQTLKRTIDIFRKHSYGLTLKVLDASLCGVPQIRKRFFLIGFFNKKDNLLDYYLSRNLSSQPLTIFEYLGHSLGLKHYYRHPRSYARRGVFSIYEPSPTIRGVNRPIPKNYQFHEGDTLKDFTQLRPLTTIERSYLQTFPKNFKWGNTTKTDLEQMIGNAVPVKLAEFVANAISEYIKTDNSLY